jgi:uncharacterized protein YjbJ (UPF0337 family)
VGVSAQIRGTYSFNLQLPQGFPVNQSEGFKMNKNQIKGAAKDIAGKVQEEAGKLVGNKEQQVKGLNKQISGKAEKAFGDVKEAIKHA